MLSGQSSGEYFTRRSTQRRDLSRRYRISSLVIRVWAPTPGPTNRPGRRRRVLPRHVANPWRAEAELYGYSGLRFSGVQRGVHAATSPVVVRQMLCRTTRLSMSIGFGHRHNKCGALPLVSLNARHKMNPPHRKSQPMWRNHSFHLSGQYSLDGISPKSFVWYALAGPWRNAETFAKDLR